VHLLREVRNDEIDVITRVIADAAEARAELTTPCADSIIPARNTFGLRIIGSVFYRGMTGTASQAHSWTVVQMLQKKQDLILTLMLCCQMLIQYLQLPTPPPLSRTAMIASRALHTAISLPPDLLVHLHLRLKSQAAVRLTSTLSLPMGATLLMLIVSRVKTI
jgi:hypothetical protein